MPRGRVATHFTPERVACVAERYAAGATMDAILAAVNALPGPSVSRSALRTRMLRMRLYEPKVYARREKKPEAAPAAVVARRPMYAGFSMLNGQLR